MSAAAEKLAPTPPAKSVLVVEDDADIRETLHGLLCAEGYDVSVCSNGLEALERLRVGRHADVILLDLMMPVMDGWQFRAEQKRDPRIASIPVLVISADGSAKGAAIDADAVLRKPLVFESLVGSIERTLLATERRKLQATLVETERLASLGTLAAGVAHEINNPLAYAMANLEYCAGALEVGAPPRDDARLRQALADTRDGCERIRRIVRDLQLFSRSPENDDPGVDVRCVLDSAANIVMNEVRTRARLTKDYGPVPLIEANATRLGQVFMNLVLNAAQAIREGDPEANEIRLVTRARSGVVTIQVWDTGEGIPPEIRGRIFDPFFTTKPIGVGTGLGLSIAHRIVTGMGGELTVESEPGARTIFSVRLPVPERAPSERPRAPRAAPKARRARLLVIDDEASIGTMLARVLADEHEVESTTDPDAAIARVLAGEEFDLILCDLMMPRRSGIDVHDAIERFSPERARRMIFLTGGASSAKAREFLARHAGMVVDKPFVVAELRRRIEAVLAELPPVSAKSGGGN